MPGNRRHLILLRGALSTGCMVGLLLLLPVGATAAPPTCTDLTVQTNPGQASSGPIPCSDPDGDAFTAFTGAPQHGTLTFASAW
jgi:hypothetical protein